MIQFKEHIQKAVPYKGGSTREETSRKIYKLSSNENLLGPSPLAVEAIKANVHSLHEYRFENDCVLREALQQFHNLPADQFLAANSGMELLDLICRAFVEEGDEVILCSPTFMAYKSFGELSGAAIIDVPLLAPDFSLDVDDILAAVTENTKIVFISNPNNPTGSLVSKLTMDIFMEALPSHVVVVYDEVYHHYVESKDYPRAIDYINQGKNVIGLHSFSKAYGLGGIRLGYAFSTPEISEYLSHLRRPFMVNTLTMVAGVAALLDKAHIAATQQLVSAEKQWLYKEFGVLGLRYWKSEANFILFKSPQPVNSFVSRMYKHAVMVRNADVMRAKGCVRVTIGTREANEAFVAAMRSAMEKIY